MIVKMQVPLVTSMFVQLALIYNEDRSVEAQVPIDQTIKQLMNGRPKAFFHASLKGETIVIENEAEWQEW